MKRILVTGATGFTGRYMTERLIKDGYEVHAFARSDAAADAVGPIRRHGIDMRQAEAVAEAVTAIAPHAVINLAGIASPAHGNIEDIYTTNLVAARHLLDALTRLDRQPECVILASSGNVYDAGLSGQIDEGAPLAPINDYGVSKLAMEHLRGIFGGRLPIVVARPFNYTGVGQSPKFVVPKIVNALRARQPSVELGNIDVSRDWSDVRFVVDCYARLLLAPAAIGGTFNICSGAATSLRQVIEVASQIAGYAIEVRFNPAFARANEIPQLWGSNARLAEAIGSLVPIDVNSTLRWMLGVD